MAHSQDVGVTQKDDREDTNVVNESPKFDKQDWWEGLMYATYLGGIRS